MNAKISVTCYKNKILSSLPLFFVNAVSLHYFKILFVCFINWQTS